MYLPLAIATALYSNIPGSRLQSDGLSFSIPCSSTAVIGFQFGETVYNIQSHDLNAGNLDSIHCVGAIFVGPDGSATIGDLFRKHHKFTVLRRGSKLTSHEIIQ